MENNVWRQARSEPNTKMTRNIPTTALVLVVAAVTLGSCRHSSVVKVPLLPESDGTRAGFRLDLPAAPTPPREEQEKYIEEFNQDVHRVLVFRRALRGTDGATVFLLFDVAKTMDEPAVVYVVRGGRAAFKFFCVCDKGV